MFKYCHPHLLFVFYTGHSQPSTSYSGCHVNVPFIRAPFLPPIRCYVNNEQRFELILRDPSTEPYTLPCSIHVRDRFHIGCHISVPPCIFLNVSERSTFKEDAKLFVYIRQLKFYCLDLFEIKFNCFYYLSLYYASWQCEWR